MLGLQRSVTANVIVTRYSLQSLASDHPGPGTEDQPYPGGWSGPITSCNAEKRREREEAGTGVWNGTASIVHVSRRSTFQSSDPNYGNLGPRVKSRCTG